MLKQSKHSAKARTIVKSNMPIISMCGLDCSDCPCFLARRNNNNELRKKTAEKWKIDYGWSELKPEDINCTGCLSSKNPHFKNCSQCHVRKCGTKKGLKNCGKCTGYDNCKKIISLHKTIPEGKNICDAQKTET